MAVPLVEIIHPEGAFTTDAKQRLLENLSTSCLRWEVVEGERCCFEVTS